MTPFRKATVVLGLMVALATLGGPVSAADAESTAVQAVNVAFVKAYNAGDVESVVAQYADDAVLLPPGQAAAVGKAAIRAYFAGDVPAAAKDGLKFVLDPGADAGWAGDLGWTSGSFHVTDKTGQVVEKGKFLTVNRKVKGKWRYLRDTWNSDGAPPAAEPAGAQKK